MRRRRVQSSSGGNTIFVSPSHYISAAPPASLPLPAPSSPCRGTGRMDIPAAPPTELTGVVLFYASCPWPVQWIPNYTISGGWAGGKGQGGVLGRGVDGTNNSQVQPPTGATRPLL